MGDKTLKRVTEDLKETFEYVPDIRKYGKREAWCIMRPDPLAEEWPVYRGDCEDFSLTVLYHYSDKSWLKFWYYLFTYKAHMRFCYVDTPDRGHAVLKFGDVYIDNVFGTTTTKDEMETRGYVFRTPAWLYFAPTTVAIKLLIGKLWKSQRKTSQ